MNPKLHIVSVPNLRDLGGHATHDGGRVRSGLLYRSAQLSNVTAADMPSFAALGLKKVYDLRTADERSPYPDHIPPGAQDVVVDVLADDKQAAPAQLLQLLAESEQANAALGAYKAEAMFIKRYVDCVRLDSARAGFGRMFSELADANNLPALFHCTTGRDRTGWAAAALLTLLGVPEDVVMQDYLLSNDYILPAYQRAIERHTAASVEYDILLSILGVRREYLGAACKEMHHKFGTIEDYFAVGLSIDRAVQERLRAQFIEG